MNLTEEEIAQLKEHAENYLSLRELAIILEVEESDLIVEYNKADSPVRKAIQYGRMITRSAIQKALITSAKNGSNPAQEKMLDIMGKISRKEDDNE